MDYLRMYCISGVLASGAALAAQAPVVCDPALAALFTPPAPQLGTYEACTSADALSALARVEWRVEQVGPADAFGSTGLYDRARLARLYGGRRVTVARGHIQHADRLESITLISPHPDPSLSKLLPGTLIIRHVLPLPVIAV